MPATIGMNLNGRIKRKKFQKAKCCNKKVVKFESSVVAIMITTS